MSASAAVLHLHNDLTHTVDEPGKINITDSGIFTERWRDGLRNVEAKNAGTKRDGKWMKEREKLITK